MTRDRHGGRAGPARKRGRPPSASSHGPARPSFSGAKMQPVYRITSNAYSYCALWPDMVPVGVAKGDTIYLFTDAKREQLKDARRHVATMRIAGVLLVGACG